MQESKISYLDYAINIYSHNCEPVSEGCKNCYAEAAERRWNRPFRGAPTWKEKKVADFTRAPAGSVCGINFFSDTWIDTAPLEWIDRIHHLVAQRPEVTFLYLTKRSERLAREAYQLIWPDNLYVGVSVELQKRVSRIIDLGKVPTRNRVVSFEPLLGPVYWPVEGWPELAWIITGGESGENPRKMASLWAYDLGREALARDIPWYHKQGSGRWPDQNYTLNGCEYRDFPSGFRRVEKPPEQLGLL